MRFCDHQGFDFSVNFLFAIDFSAATYIALCKLNAASFKFDKFKWEKSIYWVWIRISSENCFQSAFLKLKKSEQSGLLINIAILVLIWNLITSWLKPVATKSFTY